MSIEEWSHVNMRLVAGSENHRSGNSQKFPRFRMNCDPPISFNGRGRGSAGRDMMPIFSSDLGRLPTLGEVFRNRDRSKVGGYGSSVGDRSVGQKQIYDKQVSQKARRDTRHAVPKPCSDFDGQGANFPECPNGSSQGLRCLSYDSAQECREPQCPIDRRDTCDVVPDPCPDFDEQEANVPDCPNESPQDPRYLSYGGGQECREPQYPLDRRDTCDAIPEPCADFDGQEANVPECPNERRDVCNAVPECPIQSPRDSRCLTDHMQQSNDTCYTPRSDVSPRYRGTSAGRRDPNVRPAGVASSPGRSGCFWINGSFNNCIISRTNSSVNLTLRSPPNGRHSCSSKPALEIFLDCDNDLVAESTPDSCHRQRALADRRSLPLKVGNSDGLGNDNFNNCSSKDRQHCSTGKIRRKERRHRSMATDRDCDRNAYRADRRNTFYGNDCENRR